MVDPFPRGACPVSVAAFSVALKRCQHLLRQRLTTEVIDLFHELTRLRLHTCWHQPAADLRHPVKPCPRARRCPAGKLPPRCKECLRRRWQRAWNSQKAEKRFPGLCGSSNYCAWIKVLDARLATLLVQQPASASAADKRAFTHAVGLTRLIMKGLEATLKAGPAAEDLRSACKRLKETGPEQEARPSTEPRRAAAGISEMRTQPARRNHKQRIVQRMLDHIHQHYSGPMQLGDLAAAMNLNAAYVCSLFATTTGVTFHHYLEELRLAKAKELLRDPLKRVSEVAFSVGYPNPDHFRKVFRARVGISPSAWREAREPVLRG